MAVRSEEVARIARLARLALTEEETARLAAELSTILDHMDELRTVDVAGVEPFTGASEHVAAPRPDDGPADALEQGPGGIAPEWDEGFFTVPRLIGGLAEDAAS